MVKDGLDGPLMDFPIKISKYGLVKFLPITFISTSYFIKNISQLLGNPDLESKILFNFLTMQITNIIKS